MHLLDRLIPSQSSWRQLVLLSTLCKTPAQKVVLTISLLTGVESVVRQHAATLHLSATVTCWAGQCIG